MDSNLFGSCTVRRRTRCTRLELLTISVDEDIGFCVQFANVNHYRDVVAVASAEGRTAKRLKGGAHHTVYGDDVVRACVVSAQERDAVLRLSDLRDEVQRTLAAAPSLNTISRILLRKGFTTKKVEQYANDRSTPETKRKRAEWCRDVGPTLRADTSIFFDESPFSFCIMRTRGRSRKGQPAVGVVPAMRGRNHTVIAAISPTRGLLYFEIKVTEPDEEFISKRKGSKKKKKTGPKGVTRDVFRNFLIHLFEHPPFSNSSTTFKLLFDNACIHLGDIEDTIFQLGHAQQRLCAWSPELNPIEFIFSKWKLAYRVHYPPTDEEVDEAIRASASSITPTDCQH
jgi:hypothetical protein